MFGLVCCFRGLFFLRGRGFDLVFDFEYSDDDSKLMFK